MRNRTMQGSPFRDGQLAAFGMAERAEPCSGATVDSTPESTARKSSSITSGFFGRRRTPRSSSRLPSQKVGSPAGEAPAEVHPVAKPGTTPPIASPQLDAELCEFLDGCLDSRIIEKALQALDDEEVFTLDDLIIFQRLPHFGLAFKPLTAEKLTRALESRLGPGATESEESPADRGPTDTHTAMVMVDASSTGDGTEDIDEPAWLAEAGNRLSSSFSQGETTVPSPPASSTASSATAFTAPAAPAPDPLAVHAAAHLNAPPVAAPISAPIPTASTPQYKLLAPIHSGWQRRKRYCHQWTLTVA